MTNQTQSLSNDLKAHSRTTHDSVDNLVMSMQPFASTENYGKFLQAQHEFHETLRPIYNDDELNKQLSDLAELARADLVQKDMQTLNVQPANVKTPRPNLAKDAKRIGWLYCAEGSNVGAAILYKEAGKIDLTDEHGAAHLAAHPDGRMRHWKAFKAKLDKLNLNEEEYQQALEGSDEAFTYFKKIVREVYGVEGEE